MNKLRRDTRWLSKKHFLTLIIAFILWFIALLAGWPNDYYQTLSFNTQVLICVFAFFLIFPLAYITLRKIWVEDYLKSSLWLAFYFSFPLFIFDYIYAGLIKGLGVSFIFSHWYLTIFYFIVWIEIPPVGFIMDRRKEK